jgi:hypothetical protein
MKKSKFINLFLSLPDPEMKEFGRYLKTPFLNRDKRMVALYNYCKKHRKAMLDDSLDDALWHKEHIFNEICPGKPYSQRKMRDILSDSTLLLEDYIVWREMKLNKDHNARQMLLIDYYRENNAGKYFFAYAEKQLKQIDKKPMTSGKDHYNKYLLYREMYRHSSTHLGSPQAVNLVQQALNELDAFFALTKNYLDIVILDNSIQFKGMRSIRHNLPIGSILKQARKNPVLAGHPLLDINAALRELINTQKVEMLYHCKALIIEHATRLLPTELAFFLTALLNNVNYHKNFPDAKKEQFELLKLAVKYRAFIENSTFPREYFLPVVLSACKLHETEWARAFVAENGHLLPEDSKRSTLNITMAMIHSAEGDFQSVIDILGNTDFEFVDYKDLNYQYMIQAYYELNKEHNNFPIESKIEAFRLFVVREYSSKEHKRESCNNFIKILKKLLKSREEGASGKELLREIEQVKNTSMKDWLLKKAQEL